MKFSQNHRLLFGAVLALFLSLTIVVAIVPALRNQTNYAPLPNSAPLSADAVAGKRLYIANGCVACHTQQVRNVAMDRIWGDRPSIAADYAGNRRTDLWRNTATLMGTERTGPDLTSIGSRQPSAAWHLLHLYNPRSVVPASIMPAYPWLFEEKAKPDAHDVVVNVPSPFKPQAGSIVAKPEALQLVAYLLALKQTPLPDGSATPAFLYQRAATNVGSPATGGELRPAGLDGAALYASNCQACHQANGEGLKGAFPPLKGSPIVTDDNPERIITIIMKGYTGRESEGFPPMPPIGAVNKLTPAQIHAIINHERRSWGNQAREVPLPEVEKIVRTLAP
ncbi:MAG TPA: cbb3-type cytochrome c oxidase subunit II [Opitutaceae bacterium]|nr:cbb3-type cytochrome c oxidase subunit II [Opitutaceae bacterium]